MSSNVVLLFIAAAMAAFTFFLRRAGTISGTQARQLVNDGARLVDVRSPGEFSSGHINGAMNIPIDRLAERPGQLKNKAKPVVVYCASGARSARAKSLLEREGYTSVNNLGPMRRWQ